MTLLKNFMAVSILGLSALLGRETSAAPRPKTMPGSIVAIGGNEDKARDFKVLKAVIDEAKGARSRVVVVTTASAEPEARKRDYTHAFQTMGLKNFTFIYIDKRDQAFDFGNRFDANTVARKK